MDELIETQSDSYVRSGELAALFAQGLSRDDNLARLKMGVKHFGTHINSLKFKSFLPETPL